MEDLDMVDLNLSKEKRAFNMLEFLFKTGDTYEVPIHFVQKTVSSY